MDQIHAPEARSVTPGQTSVVVGVLDSGIDDRLVDHQGQVDHARSASCIGGVADSDPQRLYGAGEVDALATLASRW